MRGSRLWLAGSVAVCVMFSLACSGGPYVEVGTEYEMEPGDFDDPSEAMTEDEDAKDADAEDADAEDGGDAAEADEGAENDGPADEEICCEVAEAGEGDAPEMSFVRMTRKACVETGNSVADADACGEDAADPAPKRPRRTVTRPRSR